MFDSLFKKSIKKTDEQGCAAPAGFSVLCDRRKLPKSNKVNTIHKLVPYGTLFRVLNRKTVPTEII